MNPTISKAIRIATISGSAILVVNSATKLIGVKIFPENLEFFNRKKVIKK